MNYHNINIFILIIFIFLSGCGPTSPEVSSWAEARRAGEVTCRPIIAALEKYHTAHGRYPDSLEDLVASKLIDRIPDTPNSEEA